MRRSKRTPENGNNCSIVGWGYQSHVNMNVVNKLLFISALSLGIWFTEIRITEYWTNRNDENVIKIEWFQDENGEISYDLLKTDVQVVDINFCNSSHSYEGAMQPGMFCAGRLKEGLFGCCTFTQKTKKPVDNSKLIAFNSQVDTMLVR